jgi:hypothetical protein
MNVFEYFQGEEQFIELSLVELTANYEVWSREQVFDRVKLICDNLKGHLKKHDVLLLSKLEGSSQLQNLLTDYKKDRAAVEEEIGQLVEVHVDEPEYDDCLVKLLKVVEAHIAFSRQLYEGIQQFATKQELDKLNKQFSEVVLHSTDFNYLQEAS